MGEVAAIEEEWRSALLPFLSSDIAEELKAAKPIVNFQTDVLSGKFGEFVIEKKDCQWKYNQWGMVRSLRGLRWRA